MLRSWGRRGGTLPAQAFGRRLTVASGSRHVAARSVSSSSGAGGDSGAPAAAEAAAAADAAPDGASAALAQALTGLAPALAPFAAQIGSRRFTCTMCGKCCTGSGNVWVSQREAEAIAAHLDISQRRFTELFTMSYNRVPGWYLLRNDPSSGETRNCIFLKSDNSCAIHTVRPIQCSTYPWWPELMNDQQWEAEKTEICEGFDHPEAPPTDLAEAARQLRIATAHDMQRKLATPAPKSKQQKGQQAQQQLGQGQQQGGPPPLDPPQVP